MIERLLMLASYALHSTLIVLTEIPCEIGTFCYLLIGGLVWRMIILPTLITNANTGDEDALFILVSMSEGRFIAKLSYVSVLVVWPFLLFAGFLRARLYSQD